MQVSTNFLTSPHPSGSKAAKHHGEPRRHTAHHGLWHRPFCRERWHDRHRKRLGNSGLHRARTGFRRGDQRAVRSLLARRHPVRDADRPGALRRRYPDWQSHDATQSETARAPRNQPGDPLLPRAHGAQVLGGRSRAPIQVRGGSAGRSRAGAGRSLVGSACTTGPWPTQGESRRSSGAFPFVRGRGLHAVRGCQARCSPSSRGSR